jgi:hypothetical protein
MGARKSPMKVKQHMADERERKLHNKRPPLSLAVATTARGIEPKKFRLSRGEALRLELSDRYYRAKKYGAQAIAGRTAIVGDARAVALGR